MDTRAKKLKYIIGLTGGIGSGKTTACKLFSELGIDIIDADKISRSLTHKGAPSLQLISDHFGQKAFNKQGELDRAALRKLIFENEIEKQWLEDLLHPLIRQIINDSIESSTSPYTIIAAPLLLENSYYSFVNRILIIDTSVALQIERSTARDKTSTEQIEKIIASQISREDRLSKADDVILNDQSIASLKTQVVSFHQEYLQQTQEFINNEH